MRGLGVYFATRGPRQVPHQEEPRHWGPVGGVDFPGVRRVVEKVMLEKTNEEGGQGCDM